MVWRRRVGKLVGMDSQLTADERQQIDIAIAAVEQSTSADLNAIL
jgi:hypothetical protein